MVLRARTAGLIIATAHLSFQVWRGVRQLRVAREFTGAGPALLLGDLNLPLRMLRPALLGTGWRAPEAGPTYPSWRPGMQLDHVLGRGVHVVEARVGPHGPSDHLPVAATVLRP